MKLQTITAVFIYYVWNEIFIIRSYIKYDMPDYHIPYDDKGYLWEKKANHLWAVATIILSDGYPAIYQFRVNQKFTFAEIRIHKYVDGVERKISGDDLRHFMEGEKHEGTVALIPDTLSSNEVKMILATNESHIETGMDIESELPERYEDYSTAFTWTSEGIIKVKADEEIPLGILYISNDENDTFPEVAESSESLEDTIRGINDAGIDYAFLFTVKFGID